MLNIPIAKTLGIYMFDGASAKTEYGKDTQQTDENGVPVWSVSCFVRQADASRSESITVNVPSRTNPADQIRPFTQVRFDDLSVRTGRSANGAWVSFWAKQVIVPQAAQK